MEELSKVSAEIPEPREGRKKVKELEVMVSDVVKETKDTTTLYLFTGNDKLQYSAGHFVSIDPHQFDFLERWIEFLEDLKGRREVPRAYSLYSAPHEKHLAITIKEERYVRGQTRYPPLLSPVLVHRVGRGMRMTVIGFAGPYILPADIEARTDHLVHVCAGSGSVPNLSILKHALATGMKLRHTFIYSNKTWDDIIYRDELARLERENPEKLSVIHCVTREPDAAKHGPRVHPGRVTPDLLRKVVPDWSTPVVFACGPAITKYEKLAAKEKGVEPTPRFMESAVASLLEVGLSKERLVKESYG
jgi:3-ketosteroid 9alpha-monooxygenase subunit B